MATFIVSDLFKKECSEEMGIRPNHAIDAINHYDNIHVIQADDLEIRLHSKFIPVTRPPLYLLIEERVQSGQHQILYGLRLYSDLCENMDKMSPLDLLRHAVERFGFEIQIGQHRSKFILQEKIPVDSANSTEIVRILDAEGKPLIQQMFLKIETGTPYTANCVLCYCLDKDKYLSWLRSKR